LPSEKCCDYPTQRRSSCTHDNWTDSGYGTDVFNKFIQQHDSRDDVNHCDCIISSKIVDEASHFVAASQVQTSIVGFDRPSSQTAATSVNESEIYLGSTGALALRAATPATPSSISSAACVK
jgi:hypothetical protein